MNLFNLANRTIQVIHPNLKAIWRRSTGYQEKTKDFSPIPTFIDTEVFAQIQPLSSDALQLFDDLNIQGYSRSIWIEGDVKGVDRTMERGGDLLIFPQKEGEKNQVWKVVTTVEAWPTWAHVIAVLQNDDKEKEELEEEVENEELIYDTPEYNRFDGLSSDGEFSIKTFSQN